jgi:hypothetical protein
MTDQIKHAKTAPGYERQDIGVAGVLYFLAGLGLAALLAHLVLTGFYSFLEKKSQAEQTPVSPLVANEPVDTRKLPPEYKTDNQGADYQKYLKQNFPAPQLETDERTQLNDIRLDEDQILGSYGYVDKNAGTVRIPIDRAMELIAQRGLPVRNAAGEATTDNKKPEARKK